MTIERETLLASLAAVGDFDAVIFEDGRYLDWSTTDDVGSGRTLEVGDGMGDALQVSLSRAEMLQLHAALTRTLLADAGA